MAFGPTSTTDEVLAGVDLTGKVAVVTGASLGLGLETARAIGARGARVVMAMRDPARGSEARDVVGPNGELVALDLASLGAVRSAAAAVLEAQPTIDLLVNNAGVMATPLGRTADGFELQLGTNHLGHFLFTALLAPALRERSRIVNVSSRGHLGSGMDWDDPHYETRDYNKWQAYGQSKTANVLFTRGLAQRGFTAYAVHPGMIVTELYRYLPDDERAAVQNRPTASDGTATKTVSQGAATIVWAATADGIPTGSYLADCAIAEAAPHATDADDVERLWTWSEAQVGQPFSPGDRPIP
jgi:NAD(P)-dependent dehydrogenase (short-subunit alcohol dehydrogenase family)